MHQPRKWWIGLPILAGLVFLAAQSLTPRIEADLRARTTAALGHESANFVVSGGDVVVTGLAPAATEAARAALRDAPGLRRLAFADGGAPATSAPAAVPTAPPPRAPYVFSATLRESLLALDGRLPDEALRKRAVEGAASSAGGVAVSDGVKIEPGAPAGDFAAALDIALDALKSLSQGRVALSEGRLSIDGKGRANVRGDKLAADIKARLPQGFELTSIEIAPGPMSPYVFEAARKDGVVTLTGAAPDASTRARLVDSARRRFADGLVDDRLVIAEGAPPKFADAAEAALAAFARLRDGKFLLSDDQLTLEGAARFEGARAEIAASLADRLPQAFKAEPRLTVAPAQPPLNAAGCGAALAELSKTQVAFDALDGIAEGSAALVDALTATILRCQGVAIEVAGHVDDQGVSELNRDRSKQRAQHLVDAFVKAGADSFHVWAMGYGAERPLAANDSDENRARNRRIEFNVKQPQAKEGAQ
jgi:OmpA-OmpF porin, OOP family